MPSRIANRRLFMRRPTIIVPSKTFSFRAVQFSNGATDVIDFTAIDIGTASADRLVVVGFACQNTPTVSSIVVDPAGANTSLTQDTFISDGAISTIYSGLVASGSGAKTIRVTTVGGAFLSKGVSVWTMTGLSSNTKKNVSGVRVGGGTASDYTINVTASDYMVSMLYLFGALPAYAGSTETPGNTYSSDATNASADWIIASTNATFHIHPNNAGNALAAVTYA